MAPNVETAKADASISAAASAAPTPSSGEPQPAAAFQVRLLEDLAQSRLRAAQAEAGGGEAPADPAPEQASERR